VVAEATKERLNFHMEELGFELLGYRPMPRDNSMIGISAKSVEPICEQVFVKPKKEMDSTELERRLYVLRKYSTHSIGSTRNNAVPGNDYEFYWISLSCQTTIYKGLLRTDQLQQYYLDLQDPRVDSTLAMVHSRFSTNTFPQWKLAQPFRVIAHNGEINTIRGNVNWMKSKQRLFESDIFSQEDFRQLLPICDKAHSDSANLDSIVEMLVLAGRPLAHAMMMVIPEAWQADDLMDPKRKAFYEYHSALMEPWDGPASISFTDGKVIGATLDRNGLRPSRYCLTEDGLLVMASEAGALPVDESKVVKKGRLQPGKIFIADLEQGRIISDEELKDEICNQQPYAEWLK
jgi:glutamate synthase (NADPH/NADH) large chain